MMPDYMRRIWQSGLCPHLVPASFYSNQGTCRTVLHPEGLIRVRDYAQLCPDGIEGSFCALLQMLASAADSFALLQKWLADPAYISMDPRSLYYDQEIDRSLLLFSEQPDTRPFALRFCSLCGGLGGSGELIADRLSDAGSLRVTEEKGAAAFLRNWRRQILSAQ